MSRDCIGCGAATGARTRKRLKKSGHPGGSAQIHTSMAPQMCHSTNRPGSVSAPEIYYRIVHVALDLGNGTTVSREQTVEIALGHKGAFENANIGALTRRVPGDRTVNAVLQVRGNPKPPREPKTPRVVELLRKAVEWKALLESGKVASQAEIARLEGISRARVTQVMGLLRLAPEIREYILVMPDAASHPLISERMLRPIGTITDNCDQIQEFQKLLV